jgi:hypothetical protein
LRRRLRAQVERVHDALYVAELVAAAPESGYHFVDPDTAMNRQTLAAPWHAAGAAVLGAELVARGEVASAFCNVRPSGHHATRLSPDRFRHLFIEETGMRFRPYVLWLRIEIALAAFAAGRSLTEASHAGGFADSAHFSRTFKRMFGIAPSSFQRE